MTTVALDVGNSAVKAARWDGAAWGDVLRWPTGAPPPEALADLARGADAVGIASVVPARTEAIVELLREAAGQPALVVTSDERVASPTLRLPFAMRYRTPHTLGADRLAAAVAAWTGWGGAGRPVVALDAGTAVTLDVVAPGEGAPAYLGGAIAPGPDLLRRALARSTGQLPDVAFEAPASAIGATTDEALRAGLTAMFADGVAGLLERTTRALGAPPLVVATGGWAPWLSEAGVRIDALAPMLVLDGVRWFAEQAVAGR